jgi:hypothetical protein
MFQAAFTARFRAFSTNAKHLSKLNPTGQKRTIRSANNALIEEAEKTFFSAFPSIRSKRDPPETQELATEPAGARGRPAQTWRAPQARERFRP